MPLAWAGAALALLLGAAALLLCRRRKRTPRPPALPAPLTVHIVRDAAPRAPPRVLLLPPPAPRRDHLHQQTNNTDPDPDQPRPAPDTHPGNTQTTGAEQNQNRPRASQNFSFSVNAEPSTSSEYKGLPKLPLPEQFLHKRPFEYKFTANIPRPLAQIVCELGSDLNDTRHKKYSVTRSPSLEKDEKSPFLSAKSDKVFGFDSESVEKVNMSDVTMSPGAEELSPGNLRRFRSVSTRLNMCSVTENPLVEGQHEQLEMQNSPRVLECSSAKEKSSVPKFDFSPRLLSDSISSPRYFTPPETVSPMYYVETSPKSVYYDSVRSPKFFPETPRTDEVPQSPRTLLDHQNRNGLEKPSSPRVLTSKPSPKIYSCNKENYFTFDVSVSEDGSRLSPRPRRYFGRNSIEKERFTPPAEKEANKKYRRHHSCDTSYRQVEVKPETKEAVDVVDSCANISAVQVAEEKPPELLMPSAQMRRQRLKSISLDSDNAKIIEQNLGLPIAKQLKEQMNEAYKNESSTSCESIERQDRDEEPQEDEKSPDLLQKKTLRQSGGTQSFIDMPRFSPKEFEITVTSEEGATTAAEVHSKKKGNKNLRNLTIDLTKRDSDLEKELLEFEKLYTDAEEKKVKTPTLKVKATSLDSSETVNLSLPQKTSLVVPQNSVSVPNTPKRQLKRILPQKAVKHDYTKGGYTSLHNAERRLYIKGQDSGIFLRENHANLMLYQPGTSRMGSRTMGSFDENISDCNENPPEINISGTQFLDPSHGNLSYKSNLSVSSTNLKTLPEGVTSDDFEPTVEDEKVTKKLHRRNSNQSLMLVFDSKYSAHSSHSLQSSNCSLNSSGASCHNLATVRTSLSNFSLNTDNRQKKLTLERRDSNASMVVNEHLVPTTRVISSTSLGETQSKNCLLQRRGSNNSLTLNIASTNLSRHASNTSLNKESKLGQKKGLLERRSSNTSLTLNINTSNPQLSVNRGLSISNYNLNGSTCNLSRYNSNQSIDNPPPEPKVKGILERRSSNTSLTLNIQPQEPRDLEIDESVIQSTIQNPKHRKSLSTENLIPKSYRKTRCTNENKAFGSHDNLWSNSYTEQDTQNLTYVCGDQENEIIYAFGRHEDTGQGFTRNITTKPLSPQTTSEDFRLYLANMQHLQNASRVLTRSKLKDLNDVFQNGYSKVKCPSSGGGEHCCTGKVKETGKENPQEIPESDVRCAEYQKLLLRNLHQEFWDMPTNFQEKPIVSGSNPKNRYKTILPNEHSRVALGAASEAYINANFIKGHEYSKNTYIATQGPLQNTMFDFWLMVYQNQGQHPRPAQPEPSSPIQKVVMLTNFIENNRQKCEKYFPLELNEEMVVESTEDAAVSFKIKNCGLVQKTGYTIRKLTVRYADGSSDREIIVYHYWFYNWADHKCPKDVNALLNLSLDLLSEGTCKFSENEQQLSGSCQCESARSDSKFVFPPQDAAQSPCAVSVRDVNHLDFCVETDSPPIVVHCSAGIGRTGCLIAILNGIKQLSNEHKVDVLGIVCNMRLNRGGMVQNSEQYELVHKVLCLFEHVCLPKVEDT